MLEIWHLLLAYVALHQVATAVSVGACVGLLGWLIYALREHPTGFWFIFWGELAERASFYGMRTILALYLITVLKFEQNSAASIMSFFMASCYIAPLMGGVIADRWLGRYKTILYFSGPYILGHIILGGWESRPGLFIALGLLALGSGSIKPNTTTLMGAMYEQQKKDHLITKAFSYFYAAINVGSVITTFGLPALRNSLISIDLGRGLPQAQAEHHAYAVALMIPAAFMALAFVFFAVGKRYYPKENVRERPAKTQAQRDAERVTLQRIAGIFGLVAVFWFVYDESASTWIYFAQDHMNLVLFNNFPGLGKLSITSDQVQGLNPFLIVLLTPVFNWLWDFLKARRGGNSVPDTRKMLIGFFIVVVCMATMAAAGFLSTTSKISVWWVVVATVVITLSELCVSVVGLELAFKVAAPGTKSFVTGCFLVTVFVGDSAQGLFNKALWGKVSPGVFFGLQTVIITAAALTFVMVARKFEREHSADGAPPGANGLQGAA